MEKEKDEERKVVYTDRIPLRTTLTIGQVIYVGVSK